MSRKKQRRHHRSGSVVQGALPIGGNEPVRGEEQAAADAVATEPSESPLANEAVVAEESPVAAEPPALAEAPPSEIVPHTVSESRLATEPHSPSIGSRLRAAREAQALTRADISRLTRLPAGVVADIESDHHARLGASIYVRGYLRTYAKAVGVPEVVVNVAVDHLGEVAPPALVASHQTPRSTYLARRYGNALIYVVLTAVIVVPLLWFARQKMPEAMPKLAALDAPSAELVREIAPPAPTAAPIAATRDAIEAGPPESLSGPSAAVAVVDEPLQPVMASMAPRAERAALPQAQKVVLKLAQSSWIEFTGANGDRIEYALLPAGTVREYQVVGTADLRIGNTRGARLEIDGNSVDLAPHTRANVARISVGRPVNGGEGSPLN